MSAKQNYENLIIARADFDERVRLESEELEKETQRLVVSKLAHLAQVGRSVMTKKLGYSWYATELTFLGDLGLWLKTPTAALTKLSSDKLEFRSEAHKNQRPNGAFFVERKIIHMSDREFAKLLRTAIYARKAYLKKLDMHNAEDAIKELEADIAKKNVEIARLSNLAKTKKEELAKRAAPKASPKA